MDLFCLPKNYNILEFNQYTKSDKWPYIIYSETESLIKKIDNCRKNPEKSSTTKIGKHISCVYSISTTWAFGHIEISIVCIAEKIV